MNLLTLTFFTKYTFVYNKESENKPIIKSGLTNKCVNMAKFNSNIRCLAETLAILMESFKNINPRYSDKGVMFALYFFDPMGHIWPDTNKII